MELVRAEDFSPIFFSIVSQYFGPNGKAKWKEAVDVKMTRFARYAAPFFDISPEDIAPFLPEDLIGNREWSWLAANLQITKREEAELLLDLMQPFFAKDWKKTTRSSDLLYFAEHIVPPKQTEPKVSSDEIRLIALEFVAKELKPILPYIRPTSILDTLSQIGEMGLRMTEVPYVTKEMLDFARKAVDQANDVRLTTEPRDMSFFVAADTRMAYADLLSATHVGRAMGMGLQAIGYVSDLQRNRVNAKWSKRLRKHFGVLPLRLLLT